jgi:hypothetical protein
LLKRSTFGESVKSGLMMIVILKSRAQKVKNSHHSQKCKKRWYPRDSMTKFSTKWHLCRLNTILRSKKLSIDIKLKWKVWYLNSGMMTPSEDVRTSAEWLPN